MAKITLKRRAELDAVKVLEVMTDNGVDLAKATEIAVPMVQSKSTKYTRSRRRRARLKALAELKKQKTPSRALEAVKAKTKRKGRPVTRRLTTQEKHRRALSRIMSKRGTDRKLTKEEREALKVYTARQVYRGRATGVKLYNRREKFWNTYDMDFDSDLDGMDRDLEWMTPAEVAKKYGLEKLKPETPESPEEPWQTFTDCSEQEGKSLNYEHLKSAAPWISSSEYENPESDFHKSGFFLYVNGWLEDGLSLFDLKPGKFETLTKMRQKIVSDYFGDSYIYVEDSQDPAHGRILIKSEYEEATELASDWVDSLHYR